MSKDKNRNSLVTLMERYKDHGSPDNEAALRDIVTDIMHECDESGYDFDGVLKGAGEVFEQEKLPA